MTGAAAISLPRLEPGAESPVPTTISPDLTAVVDLIASHPSDESVTALYGPNPSGIRRRRNLERYLNTIAQWRPTIALIGEAPGYRGSVRTGVPFVSEQQATDPGSGFRSLCSFEVELALEGPPRYEVTSAVMWQTLGELDLRPLLWSACSRHPHAPRDPSSNRTPTKAEVAAHRQELSAVLEWAGTRKVVAVGAVAARQLGLLEIPHERVRHPARGGAKQFRHGLSRLSLA